MDITVSAPLSVQWELTPWCTYNCVHCYNYWRRGRQPERALSAEQIVDYSKVVQELISNKVFHVTLTGGEPLGILEQIFPELMLLERAGVILSINSNLALLDEGLVVKLHDLGVRTILTSLMSSNPSLNDAIAQQKGAFKRTVRGIKLAISSGFQVSVNMVVSQANFHSVYETGQFAYSLGAAAFCATKASKPSNCPDFTEYQLSSEQVRQMFHTLLSVGECLGIRVASLEHYPACLFDSGETRTAFGGRNCTAARTSCTIGFDGSLRPCSHAPMSYGNVVDIGLREAWINMGEWRDGSLVPSVCKQVCGEFPDKCGGGCRIESLNQGSSVAGCDPYSLNKPPVAMQCKGKSSELPMGSKVRLRPQVLSRTEEFGYIMYSSSSKWLPVDEILYNLLRKTLEGESIGVGDLVSAYSCSDLAALKTLQFLRDKRIVKVVSC